MRIVWIHAAAVALALLCVPASAQVPPDAVAVALVDAEPGSVATVAPSAEPSPRAMASIVAMDDRMMTLRQRLRATVSGIPAFPGRVAAFLEQNATGMGAAWPLYLVALAILFLGIGHGAERWYANWARAQFTYIFRTAPGSRAERISYLMSRAALQAVGVAIQAVVAVVLVIAADIGGSPGRATGLATVMGVALARLAGVVFRALLAPDRADCRLPRLDDAAARSLFAGLRAATWVAVAVSMVCLWLAWLGFDLRTDAFILVLATSIVALSFAVLAVAQRRVGADLILGPPAGDGAERPLPTRLMARTWHVLAIVYLVMAWAISVYRELLAMPNAVGLVLAPVVAGLAGLTLYGIALLAVDRLFRGRGLRQARPGSDPAAGPRTMRGLADHAAGLVVVVLMAWAVAAAWGVDLLAGVGAAGAVVNVLVVIFLAYVAFQAVKITIDNRIAEEGGPPGADMETADEGGGAGASRLATLLPIFRNFLLAVIVSIAGMVVLSELGVDIAPLFAGAGVVGLAVGFGAQTLIRDIFSGAFFLLDDAFRKGEYVDIGGTKGTVERISIRSLQLRHQLGPLHTVPFGEISRLTNYSRDWVVMKLPLRVTYDTDVEAVRKIIKNLGAELLAHPEIGHRFLEPLKSQGVYTMEDSAMIVRVKFMTRPGDQFQVRKIVYQRIRELFEQAGIRFAHREVTVRLAGAPADRPLTTAEKEAVAGAALPALDQPVAAARADTR